MTTREQQQQDLARLKDAFKDASHLGIDVAFDAAEAVLVRVLGADCDRKSARNLTLAILKGVMDRGFMIIHRDELHNALIASAQAGKILLPEAAQKQQAQPLT